ncbi:FMN-dependent NADPH-azoreductase-like [Paramacrobiotus metropolitanus]|uniref:FMN-dependent NADPH-azoreductase-like n=1 Tax=Paramacrobiotus metropolitanus TaxID=2943436 RepID=UPI0024460663|nr:FMN-dependent NADPH-azoreductase-like [Paramacrobiotus metropolitanus]
MMAPLITAGLNILVFLGSVRENRNADRVKPLVIRALESANLTLTVFDPKDFNYSKVVQPLHYYANQEDAPESLKNFSKVISKADGFVIVSPEYHGAIAPSLSTLMDQFPPLSYAYRPGAIVTYSKGRFGGVRAQTQLRTYLSELGMVHIPSVVSIAKVEETVTKNGTTTNAQLLSSLDALVEELVWFAKAVKNYKHKKQLLFKGKVWI